MRSAAHSCCPGRPPAHALMTPIFLNGLTHLIGLLRSHRWLPSTLGTKSNSLAWRPWRPSVLFNRSPGFCFGNLPPGLVGSPPRNSGGLQAVADHPPRHPRLPRRRVQIQPILGPCPVPRPPGALRGSLGGKELSPAPVLPAMDLIPDTRVTPERPVSPVCSPCCPPRLQTSRRGPGKQGL